MNDTSIAAKTFDNKSLAFVIGIAVLAPIVFLVLPVVIGALYTELGLSESELGLLASVELLGIAIAAASGLYWTTRWNWRTVARASIAAVLVGNVITYAVLSDASSTQLIWLRFVVGLSSGCLMAIVYTYLASHPETEKAGGILVGLQVVTQIVGVYLLPGVIASSAIGGLFLGAKGIFLTFAIMSAILLVVANALPTGAGGTQEVDEVTAEKPTGVSVALVVLLSFLLFFVAITAIWGFLELLGGESGIEPEKTTLAITLSLFFAIAGAAFAGYFGDRFGQTKPLVVAALMQISALVIIAVTRVDFTVFLISMALFQMGWNLALPYHFGVIADVDPSHRFIVLTSPAQAIGIAIGPVFGGVFIESFGYIALFIASGVVLAMYLGCILPFSRNASD